MWKEVIKKSNFFDFGKLLTKFRVPKMEELGIKFQITKTEYVCIKFRVAKTGEALNDFRVPKRVEWSAALCLLLYFEYFYKRFSFCLLSQSDRMKKSAVSRRNFLKQSSMASLGFIGLHTYLTTTLESCTDNYTPTEGNMLENMLGRLVPDPRGLINLPVGFSYKIIAQKGDPMSDGLVHPDKPDGMATFQGSNGRVILIRNHELMPTNFGPFGENSELVDKVDRSKLYDYRHGNLPCSGGTTTLIINEDTLEVERSWLSLGGTLRNCAGGVTPWNSWISCEEIVLPASNGFEQRHGFNFEVPASEKMGLANPIPLKAMGQFNHEAICIDPRTGIVYQTEDREDGLIYRFIPDQPGKLAKGGKLQALVVKDLKRADTRNWKGKRHTIPVGLKADVQWVDLKDVENVPEDDLRDRGFHKGAAKFARGEGMWFGNNEVYFACTAGGSSRMGQIFKYYPSPKEGTPEEKDQPGQLELYLEPNNAALLRHCDNLTVAPWGDVVVCEDNTRPKACGVTKDGQFYQIAESVFYESEFAGGVFSPSGKTYFVNIQHAGLTIAIQGDWSRMKNSNSIIGS